MCQHDVYIPAITALVDATAGMMFLITPDMKADQFDYKRLMVFRIYARQKFSLEDAFSKDLNLVGWLVG